MQKEAAKGFLDVLRTYLDSLCSNLRSHTITNVQSNDDKVRFYWYPSIDFFKCRFWSLISKRIVCSYYWYQVSLLLKESFIESFPSRNRPFMKVRKISTSTASFLFQYVFMASNISIWSSYMFDKQLFLDTQLFSVHTDFILSFFQKE